ncbi:MULTISPECIES: helix-turn-helix domain-containing protein [Pyrobaculum]|uniref:Bacterio-opsin activator, HTH domain protein n=2 Tax=Pyrobaculum arsenaticum TaxID=121277 RepID=A4WKR9_PYRAR|nr:helix-turn-helix domain-containing protein [Pyrobaculum arsenaticum]ABP50986.1 Bacterio-opsin activator, HTH domain protein [Pyrobaculum arsenaticum DSM 13514]MCY0889620.1 helix-turn-helix domain-containing protein [Pyrobaculum arsenaticum]NYR15290.1 bacterio-opsin activator [Pyrobaculum arsenaticum]
MALRVTITFRYDGSPICGDVIGMNLGHLVLADEQLSKVECDVCQIIQSYGAVIAGGRICRGKATFMVVASTYQLARILKELHDRGLQPRVVGRAKYIKEPELTEDQLKLLDLAYRMGFFDESRKISLKDLASMVGVSPSAADRRLRRALRKLVEHYLSKYGKGEY